MNELENPVLVEFPLEGEWFAPNTPALRVPSHGTDTLGMRYAYDFMMTDSPGKAGKPFRGKIWHYNLLGMPLPQWYGWGKNIYAPGDGKIIVAKDGLKERHRVHLVRDMFVVLKNALFFDPEKRDMHDVAGNYIIMELESSYAMLAHFQTGSICVTEGQEVKAGALLGRVGHSGNSTAPHLHFQLMDSPDLVSSQGVPCAFKRYERLQNDQWEVIEGGIPSNQDRVRRCSLG